MGFFPTALDLVKMLFTLSLVLMAWVFFRSTSLSEALSYFAHLFQASLFELPQVFRSGLVFLLPFVLFEWVGKNWENPLTTGYRVLDKILLGITLILIILFGQFRAPPFIYFQF